ncbi:MAG: hypothetical protein ACC652_06020 [Acidimicrobiales bacterium]
MTEDISNKPGPSMAPTLLPSAMARALAFAAIIIAGISGGLIGYAVADIRCSGDCDTARIVSTVIGAIFTAGGVAIVAVLVLRAMSEWNATAPVDQRNA